MKTSNNLTSYSKFKSRRKMMNYGGIKRKRFGRLTQGWHTFVSTHMRTRPLFPSRLLRHFMHMLVVSISKHVCVFCLHLLRQGLSRARFRVFVGFCLYVSVFMSLYVCVSVLLCVFAFVLASLSVSFCVLGLLIYSLATTV